jgi:hypothetical protein
MKGIQVSAAGILRKAVANKVLRMILFNPAGEADALEGSVESPFDDIRIRDGGEDLLWDIVTAGNVVDMDRSAVDGNTEKKDIKVRRFYIFVNTALTDVDAAEGFKVD